MTALGWRQTQEQLAYIAPFGIVSVAVRGYLHGSLCIFSGCSSRQCSLISVVARERRDSGSSAGLVPATMLIFTNHRLLSAPSSALHAS
jgi:hypothetical protein